MTVQDDLAALATDLISDRAALSHYDAYFENGVDGELEIPRNARQELRSIIESGVTNWLKLVIETTAERLIVDGFRREDQDDTNSDLWKIWQDNRLDGRQMALNVETLRYGYSYVSVWPREGKSPVVAPESPLSVRVAYDGDDPFEPTSAFKIRGSKAWLYTPDEVVRLVADTRAPSRWIIVETVENTLGEVPFVKFRANPDNSGGHSSDLDVAIPIQQRINRTNADRLHPRPLPRVPTEGPDRARPRHRRTPVTRSLRSTSPSNVYGRRTIPK